MMRLPWQCDDSDEEDKGIFVVSNGNLNINIIQPTESSCITSGGLTMQARLHADSQQVVEEAEREKADEEELHSFEFDDCKPIPAKRVKKVASKPPDGPRRNKLLTAWLTIVMIAPWASETGVQVSHVEEEEALVIIRHTVSDKATATLASRLCSLGGLVKWCAQGINGVWWPPPEWGVYQYVTQTATEHDPLTRANQLMEAMVFFFFTFGCWAFKGIVSSRRIVGLAQERMAKLGVRKQAKTMSLHMLITLENLVFHGGLGVLETLVIGGCLFLMYARARFSDFDSLISLEWFSGVLVATVIGTKTSRRHTDRLPVQITIPLCFASGLDWLKAWLQWRENLGIPLLEWPVFPSRDGNEEWINKPAAGYAVCAVFRNVLTSLGEVAAGAFSLHSCKTMWLYVCSMVGVEDWIRQILGHHASKATTTVRTYSRDTQAHPVKILRQIIQSVESGAIVDKEGGGIGWKVDEDRHEFQLQHVTVGDGYVEPDAKEAALMAADESDSDSDDEGLPGQVDDPEEGQRLYDEGFEDAAESMTEMATRLFLEGIEVDGRYFMNQENSKVHRGRRGSEYYMACGKVITDKMVQIASGPEENDIDTKFCRICFLYRRPEVSMILKRSFSQASEPHWDSWNNA